LHTLRKEMQKEQQWQSSSGLISYDSLLIFGIVSLFKWSL
jgi:hypothetical protein